MLENNCLDRNYKWFFFYKNGEWDSNPELSNAGRAHYQVATQPPTLMVERSQNKPSH